MRVSTRKTDLHPYLIDTKPAVIDLISLLGREKHELSEKTVLEAKMTDRARELFGYGKKSGFTSELVIELAGFEEASRRFKHEASEVRRSLMHLKSVHSVFATALLQVAKQGISAVHGSLDQCPGGRLVGRESLKSVIWAARNQAMHYEEGKFSKSVTDCFRSLEADFGAGFSLGVDNLSDRVVELLGWYDYNQYEADMASLLC